MMQPDSTKKKTLQETILQAKQGNQEAFERLLVQYRPLIASLVSATARELPFSSADYEDLYQEAMILFYRAVEKYDTKQESVAFGLFAKICIRNGLKTQAKRLQSSLCLQSLECDEGAELAEKENPADRLAEAESYRLLCQCVSSTLTEYENRVWWLYLSGRTAKEIAELLQRDEKSVHNAIFRIRRKLKTVIPHP